MSTLTHPLQHISGKHHDRRLKNHEGTVSIGGRAITHLRVADDIDGLAGAEEEPEKLVECLDKASKAYGMEISAEKTKLSFSTLRIKYVLTSVQFLSSGHPFSSLERTVGTRLAI